MATIINNKKYAPIHKIQNEPGQMIKNSEAINRLSKNLSTKKVKD